MTPARPVPRRAPGRRWAAAAAGLVLLSAAACASAGTEQADDGGGGPVESSDLAPSIPPIEPTAPSSRDPGGAAGPASSSRGTSAGVPADPSATRERPANTPNPTTPATVESATSARVTDGRGDVDWTLQRPPAYVDIARADLIRSPSGYELRVRFADEVPTRQTDSNRTMNVASFYDVDGDGAIDFEVWANLADDGWGPSYRDNRKRDARFMADSGVRVRPDGSSVVFRFPLTHLNSAATLRWAVASEWGPYEAIATPTASSDHAPNAGAAPFPR